MKFCSCSVPSQQVADGRLICGECGELVPDPISRLILQELVQIRLRLEAIEGEPRASSAEPAFELLTPAQVAELLGRDRAWVYAHADELGALRFGEGPKSRLLFNQQTLAERLSSGSLDRRLERREPQRKAETAARQASIGHKSRSTAHKGVRSAVSQARDRRRPFGLRCLAQRLTSARSQTGVARSRATGSGKSSCCVQRIAFRRDVSSSSATSASPTSASWRRRGIPSMMVTERKCPRGARTPGGRHRRVWLRHGFEAIRPARCPISAPSVPRPKEDRRGS